MLTAATGEATLYVCSYSGKEYVAKVYRRAAAVKDSVVAALRCIDSPYVAQLFETEALLNRVLAQEQCFSLRQLAVNGADLQALGLRGRPVGEMLHTLLDAVIDGRTDNRRDTLLRLARTRMEEQHVK